MGKSIVIFLIGVGFLAGCGRSDNAATTSEQENVFSQFQRVPPTEIPNLVSAFGITPSAKVGGFAAFYSNKTYFSGVVQKLNSNRYRMAAVVGYYEEADGIITTSGKKTTCQAWAKHKGKATVAGTTNGNRIFITTGATSAVLERLDIASTSPPPGGFLIEWGCFDEVSGEFTPHPWSDIP